MNRLIRAAHIEYTDGIGSIHRYRPIMLEISRDLYDELVSRSRDGGEREVCGVLGGRFDADHSVATTLQPTPNVAERPEIRYEIDPEELLERIEAIEDDGLDVVGFYHSHPAGPTVPSETDAAQATWTDRSYVIVALDGYPSVGSWRWRGEEDAFEQEPVRVTSADSER